MQTKVAYDCTEHFVHFAYKFTGKERDTETGLDYFYARYYSSEIGRFISPDPPETVTMPSKMFSQIMRYPQDWNKYMYSLNDPLSHKDDTGNFTGRDHKAMEVAALSALGFSSRATAIAAEADARMDNFHNMLSGVAVTNLFFNQHDNPAHGEQRDRQGISRAKFEAEQEISTHERLAAGKALMGDYEGALIELGRAGHTAQDIIRHKFEAPSEHPWHEASATVDETAQGIEATKKVEKGFEHQLRDQGREAHLSDQQIGEVLERVKQGKNESY